MNLLDHHCTDGAPALESSAITTLLTQVPDWRIVNQQLHRDFAFRDYHATIAFVNALAVMTHQQDHHPTLSVSYRHCVVNYQTDSAGGALSINDFICAAKADALYAQRASA